MLEGWDLALAWYGRTAPSPWPAVLGELAAYVPATPEAGRRIGFPLVVRRCLTEEYLLSSTGSWGCRCMEVFIFRVGHHIVPRCGGISTFSEGAALAVPCTYGRCQNKESEVGLEVSTLCGEGSTKGKQFRAPGCKSVVCYQRFRVR